MKKNISILVFCTLTLVLSAQMKSISAYKVDTTSAQVPDGYSLIWADEFNIKGKPNEAFWGYEEGFVRNFELQWYSKENVSIDNGLLVIEGRREQFVNPHYDVSSNNWRLNRAHAEYTSGCIITKDRFTFKYGIMEVRARIDTSMGMWPAIWTLGVNGGWPANGEVDQMEFYRENGIPKILANAAWEGKNGVAWDSEKIPYNIFSNNDAEWDNKFHIWKMDWTETFIKLYLDGELLNEIDLAETINPDGTCPFHQAQYLLLNLAIGSNGGDPSNTRFPRKYEVDYVRVYQKEEN